MEKKIFIGVMLLVFAMLPQKSSAQFADPWYNWYFSQQMMLNQQMLNMQWQQHQITEAARQRAQQAEQWLREHPTDPNPYATPNFSNSNSDVCRACRGTGTCRGCDGTGQIKNRYNSSTGTWSYRRCTACKGSGRCQGCN